ncbi:MAG: N-methylhydantoinase [Frankiales bacterium]|nr:N-methylhydantoinase [Frankiales bacterium]
MTKAFDAIDVELFRHAVGAVVDELDLNITRTAYSPIVYDYKDFCVGIITSDFKLINQSKYNLPFFLADLGTPVQDAVGVIGAENLRPGDVFLTNYGAVSGQQLNHVITCAPLFQDSRIAGYVAIRSHWVDVGGQALGSSSWNTTNLLQEGFQMRGLKIVDAGRLVPEVLATIEANTYMPVPVVGDLMALLAAASLGARRWEEFIASRWSLDEIFDLVEAQLARSRSAARAAVKKLPDGEYSASYQTDDAGSRGSAPLVMSLRITIKGERITVDLSDLPPQTNTPINTGAMGGAVSTMRLAYKALVAPNLAADDGLFEALEVEIPPGTVLSAVGNAPMSQWNMTMASMIDLFFRAIGSEHPELVAAGHHATMAGLKVFWVDDAGNTVGYTDGANGGFGGNDEADGFGPLKTLMHGDNRSEPLELTESRAPIRFLEHALRTDAGGAGLHRGGPGVIRSFEVLKAVTITTFLDRTLDPPWGLAGGMPGKPGAFEVKYPDAEDWVNVNKVTGLPLPAGTIFRQRTAGGGGWGTPAET